MPDLLLGGRLSLLAAIGDLIGLLLLATVALINLLSDHCVLAATLIHCGFLSASDTLAILDVGLGLCRAGARAAHRRKTGELLLKAASVSKIVKSTKHALAHAAHATNASEASHASEASETAAKATASKEVISTSEELIRHVILILLGAPFAALFIHFRLLMEAESATSHKVIIIIEERMERISSTKELSEYLIGVVESKVGPSESLEPTSELRAARATSIEHVLAPLVIYSAFVFVREALVRLTNLLEYLLGLHLHGLILMFILSAQLIKWKQQTYGVPLDCQLAIGLLDIILSAVSLEAEHLIVIVTVEFLLL